MKELSRRSLTEVHDVIHGQNYVNIKARLVQFLSQEYSNTFANVKFFDQVGIWYVDDDISCFRYKDASQEEKDEAAAWLEECRNYISSQLAEKMPYWSSLFVIPSDEQIFLYKNATGDTRVILSEWGFEPKGPGKKIDVIGILIDAPRLTKQEEVTIHIEYSDGTVANDVPFSLTAFNNTRTVVTNDVGDYYLGKIFAGKPFSVESTDGLNHCDFTVESGVNIYKAVFDYSAEYVISVENQYGQPKVNFPLEVNGNTVHTDESGRVSGSMKLLPDSALAVKANDQEFIFTLNHDSRLNDFLIKVDDLQVVPPPPPPPAEYVTVTLLDFDGQPLPDLPFKVTQRRNTIFEGVTDKEGKARIKREVFGTRKRYKVRFEITDSYRQQLETNKQNGK